MSGAAEHATEWSRERHRPKKPQEEESKSDNKIERGRRNGRGVKVEVKHPEKCKGSNR